MFKKVLRFLGFGYAETPAEVFDREISSFQKMQKVFLEYRALGFSDVELKRFMLKAGMPPELTVDQFLAAKTPPDIFNCLPPDDGPGQN